MGATMRGGPGGGDELGDDQRQLLVYRLGSLQRTAAASLAWQGLIWRGTASAGGASEGDGTTTTWLVADRGD